VTPADHAIRGIKDLRQSGEEGGKGKEARETCKGPGKQAAEMEEQLEGDCKTGVGDSAATEGYRG